MKTKNNKKKVGIGIIGLGGRGTGLLKRLLKMDDIRITGLCDAYPDRVENAKKLVGKTSNPFCTDDYKALVDCPNVEIVLVAASWERHVEMAVYSMQKGKYTASEVGGSFDLAECYTLVDAYERTKTPFFFLENCCFGRRELMCKVMAEQGVFGKIVQMDGAYCHDLRNEVSFGKENRHYRLNHYIKHNADNYPTHDLGPIAKILDINGKNQMTELISISGMSCGLHDYIKKNKSDDSELLKTTFSQSDVVTTFIKCKNGELIRLVLETTLPHHYSRQFAVHGTKGMYREDGRIMLLDDYSSSLDKHAAENSPEKMYNSVKKFEKKFDHPLWKKDRAKMKKAGHGGIDYLVLREMVESYKDKREPYIDVYDAASWMCITALSEESIKNGSTWVSIPDFKNRK